MRRRESTWQYIKGYRFNRLLIKNFIYVFVLVTLPLLLVLSLNYNKFDRVVNNRVMDMNEELLLKNAVVTDNMMMGLLNNLNQMSQLSEVMEIVQISETDTSYRTKAMQTIEEVENYTKSNSLITASYIYSDVNGILLDKNGINSANKGKWYDIHKQDPMVRPYILVNNANSIFACQPIWSANGQRIGLFVLDVDLQKLRDILDNQKVTQDGIFFIMDAGGRTIYCNEQGYTKWDAIVSKAYEDDIASVPAGESLLVTDHGQRVISVMESTHKSWNYAYVTELSDYRDELGMVRGFLLSSILVGVLTSGIVAFVITIFTYRPVRKIVSVIENPQLHWDEKQASKESNELLFITGNILADSDHSKNKDVSEELGARIRSLRQAQFRALQFQIDPHFLYNTLETIKWNAVEEMGLGNKTSKMLTKVARLYRLGLENDDVIVTLKEELDFLKLYIEILRIRFGESVQFHWDIDEKLQDFNIIKMCLQPIVENAIQHGLRPKNYQGNITVSARYENECLVVAVEDDGQSMSPAEMKKLNEKLKTGSGFEESKVGLRNVNERIKLIYGKKYGVSVSQTEPERDSDSQTASNVRVVLTFPCRNLNRSEETK